MGHAANGEAVLVADVGATFVRAAKACDGRLGRVLSRPVADLPRDPVSGIVDAIIEVLNEVAAVAVHADGSSCGCGRPVAVGIGIAAAVDDSGALMETLPFGVPAGRFLRDRVGTALGVPVTVGNDGSMAALGELVFGAGRGRSDILILTLGTNLGMGIISRGEVYRGAHGGAGEVGLLLVPTSSGENADPRDDPRRVVSERFGSALSRAPEGYGWIEEFVGGGALSRALATARADHAGAPGPLPRLRVLQEASAGDHKAREILQRGIEGWAFAIANAVALLDPAAIIIAGGLSEDLAPFLDSLRERVAELSRAVPEVLIAELGSEGGLIGAQVAASRLLRSGE